jgi:hypothetical protein
MGSLAKPCVWDKQKTMVMPSVKHDEDFPKSSPWFTKAFVMFY